jgi:hypothetical protein
VRPPRPLPSERCSLTAVRARSCGPPTPSGWACRTWRAWRPPCSATGAGHRGWGRASAAAGAEPPVAPWQLLPRHVDHSGGLAAVVAAASRARAAAAAGTHEPPPLVFDVHPERPLRRGLLVPGPAGLRPVPFNEVSCVWSPRLGARGLKFLQSHRCPGMRSLPRAFTTRPLLTGRRRPVHAKLAPALPYAPAAGL